MAGNQPTDDDRALEQEPLGLDHHPPSAEESYDVVDPDQAMLRVRVSLKGRPIRSYTFDKSVITVGRDPDSDVHLDNPGISRHQLRMEKTPQGYYAEDLGSANGSYLNDELIQKELLKSDDVLRVGKFSLWISYEEDRRAHESSDRAAAPPPQAGTTVLSTGELEAMMAKARQADASPVKQERPQLRPRSGISKAAFTTWIIVTLLAGAGMGVAVYWFLTR